MRDRDIVVRSLREGIDTSNATFKDGSLGYVYADNVIEHITLEQARVMLAEAYRCLQPGGVIRLVTPDLRKHVELYLAGAASVTGDVGRAYPDMGLVVEHPVDLVRIPIVSFGHHLGYIYDFETLDAELRRAGFDGATEHELGHNPHAGLQGMDQRTDEGGALIAVESVR